MSMLATHPRDPWSDPRLPALLLGLACVAVLGNALFFQFVLDIRPCVLCIWQRWPFGIVLALSLAGLSPLARRRAVRTALLALSGVVLFAGAAIAVFHVGVEQHWWTGTPGCGVPAPAHTLEELRAQVMAAPVVRCDEAAWRLFGLSLAGYNAILSPMLAAFALLAAARSSRGTSP
jgi:disulfide bond formation protein DsbB